MHRVLTFLLFTLSSTGAISDERYELSKDSVMNHVTVLGSDLMEGRRAGSEGYRQAVEYAASVLANAQIQTMAEVSGKVTFLQMFEIPVTHVSPPMQSFNVIGFVEGQDASLKDEYVVVGAHLDGLGIGGWLLQENQTPGVIHNGANDNATGAAVVLELAKYFAKTKPERSVVVGLWSAEEIGRHGVKHFINNSPIRLENVVAHINLDGVGRSDRVSEDKKEIYALGAAELCGELEAVLDGVSAKTPNFSLNKTDEQGWFKYGDHYEFHLAGVPSVFITDLGSDDYHQPTDDVELIDADQLFDVTKLTVSLTERLANSSTRVCPR